MIDWQNIHTVFLDMDGTLLDLHFDNYFWLHHVPLRYAEKHGMEKEAAQAELYPHFRRMEGTMDWYCVDYWTRQLGLDIAMLKQEVDHLIDVHPYVTDFLDALREAGKRSVLVTNAHSKSLALKLDRTQLGGHFDKLVCAHDLGLPKEQPGFWQQLQQLEPFAPQFTLLVDDNLATLGSARNYGIEHLLAIRKPDSQKPPREVDGFPAIEYFAEILPVG